MTDPPLLAPSAILATARTIPGWLADDEAELLIGAAAHVAREGRPAALVEIGSYLGRSTIVLAATLRALSPGSRLFAVDPHEGTVGAADAQLDHGASTFDRFTANIRDAGVGAWVEPIRALSFEVDWDGRPIDLLFIDGLHDRMNVERDFRHFERFLDPGALVLFHDYADYYPGVRAMVDELVAGGGWRVEAAAGTLRVLCGPTAA
jgi:predicted O-methyltransferase YrrM